MGWKMGERTWGRETGKSRVVGEEMEREEEREGKW